MKLPELMERYGVTNWRDLLRAIRDQFQKESGEPKTISDAKVVLGWLLAGCVIPEKEES